jgi:FAD/FMN-containing dehydrogenase
MSTTRPLPSHIDAVAPGDVGYDLVRGTFSAAGSPDIVVRPRTPAEVAVTVQLAVDTGHALSVRSGGHSAMGHSTHDHGVVLDLAHLDAVDLLDRTSRRVRIGGGATWDRVASVLAQHDLGISAGDTRSVGVGGLTLGGGIGWRVRRHGLAIDSLVAAEVVTAEGRLLRVDADHHPDLFWAVRGGGGNFGVVIAFEFEAQPVRSVHYGTVAYALDDVAGLVRRWRDAMWVASDDLSSTLVLMPGLLRSPLAGLVLVCQSGEDPDAAREDLALMHELGDVPVSHVEARSYADVLEDAQHPPGVRIAAHNTLVDALDDDLVARIAVGFDSSPDPTVVSLRSLGGAVAGVPAAATAFAHRRAEAMVVSGSFLPADANPDRVEQAVAPWRDLPGGAYVNFLSTATEADLAKAYPTPTRTRLTEVKKVYDPGNVFRRNHNITPSDG